MVIKRKSVNEMQVVDCPVDLVHLYSPSGFSHGGNVSTAEVRANRRNIREKKGLSFIRKKQTICPLRASKTDLPHAHRHQPSSSRAPMVSRMMSTGMSVIDKSSNGHAKSTQAKPKEGLIQQPLVQSKSRNIGSKRMKCCELNAQIPLNVSGSSSEMNGASKVVQENFQDKRKKSVMNATPNKDAAPKSFEEGSTRGQVFIAGGGILLGFHAGCRPHGQPANNTDRVQTNQRSPLSNVTNTLVPQALQNLVRTKGKRIHARNENVTRTSKKSSHVKAKLGEKREKKAESKHRGWSRVSFRVETSESSDAEDDSYSDFSDSEINPENIASSSQIIPSIASDRDIPRAKPTRRKRVVVANADSVPNYNRNYELADHQEVLDIGDPTFTCPFCQASLWYDERLGRSRKSKKPKFSLCCLKGKVVIPFLEKPPTLLHNLLNGSDSRSKHFNENIRAYNSMFAFTSIGGKVVNSLNNGGGPPQFILSGQNYHRIGSLIPEPGKTPKFAQLYIYDTHNEKSNRMKHFSHAAGGASLDATLVEDLCRMVDDHNELAKTFRRVRDFLLDNQGARLSLRLFRHRGRDPRTYNLPTSDEVAAIIVGDFSAEEAGRDIIVKQVDGNLERLHETHTAFIPLQYPLVFPYGEDGYQEKIKYSEAYMGKVDRKRFRVTLREFIAFRIQDRKVEYGNIIHGRRLFQQFLVDTYTMVEAQRLSYIQNNQSLIRADFLSGLEDAIHRGETDPTSVGMRIILPSSFTGGKRYMFNNCQDAMAVCKKFGYPDLFITMTCNAAWKEIKRYVRQNNLRADERPDVCCRVFKVKLEELMLDIKKGKIFGGVDAGMYTIEFQKRGLPHAHILLWLKPANKINTCQDIDQYISAELPDPILYPNLYKAVSTYMMHGPCGVAEPNSPCMENWKCSKYFPKGYQTSTKIDQDGYPVYKRRNSGITVVKKGVSLDNGFVVPYNPYLLMRYQGHINVEYCNKSNSIKYLFKYVSKGPDRVSVHITNEVNEQQPTEVEDEIKQFYDCRYLTPCEAVWRILAFDIHSRWPPVMRLTFHLPNEQRLLFRDDESLEDVLNRPSSQCTMFMAWMEANAKYEEGRGLCYAEFPNAFVFNKKKHCWRRRKKGFSIGRLQYIPPGIGELYYMRVLLTIQKGCTSFESIRTVDGVVYATFHDACYALGLLEDDKEYIEGIIEASDWSSGNALRRLFVSLLMTNTMSKPELVWEKTWKILSEGIEFHKRRELNIPDLRIDDEALLNYCLIEIEKLMHSNGRSLKEFSNIPYPDFCDNLQYENKFVADELNYDKEEMQALLDQYLQALTPEQNGVYEEIIDAVHSNSGGFFFLYGFGGTGKTFIWNTLSASLRSKGLICVNAASSGIASLLLPGGRTAHSKFSIPIAINEDSTCNIKQGTQKAELLQKASLIIWDEAPMLNRHCFEALDRTLNDLMKCGTGKGSYVPFGGKVIVLGGDFRQILPVIQKGSRSDIVGATINSSHLWKHCKILRLTKNMRLMKCQSMSESEEIKNFADWILNVGDGKVDDAQDGDWNIDIPEDLLITDKKNPIQSLIDFAYPDLLGNLASKNYKYFEDRAVLAPTLESVEKVNLLLLSMLPGEEKEYLSYDKACSSDKDAEVEGEWFTTEFLNDVKCSGIPNHKLILKVGVPIMLMRNINQSLGLCNGTRCIVSELGERMIGAYVVTGKHAGDKIVIPRMNLTPTDPGLPFKFQRKQFPVSLCFAMTINKSQGQSLSHVGLFLPKPVFTHGQLYVALSRVKSRKGLKILILDEDDFVTNSTKNVVYNEVFDNV